MPGRADEGRVRVLFVNTRSDLGADVAVHLLLLQHFDPAEVEAHIVTNRNSVDLEKTLRALESLPPQHIRVWDLGNEISLTAAGHAGKALAALRNLGLAVSLVRLAGYVRANRIDILHGTDRPRDALVGMLLSRLSGRPHLVHLHIKWYPEIGRLTRMAVERCRGILAISRFVHDSLIQDRIPASRIYTVWNATDPALFDPAVTEKGQFRQTIGLTDRTPLIGIVARVILWKGHLELIEALALVRQAVPDVHLAIVGHEDRLANSDSDSFSARVRRRICELGLESCVHWAGWRDNAPQIMADLDVLAVPSWEEPFGLVVTEAMAMERPIVGFASGALPEIVTNGIEGLLTPPRDPRMLADGLITLLQNPALRAEMGRRGRQRVLRRFAPARQATEVARVYRRILAGEPDDASLVAKRD